MGMGEALRALLAPGADPCLCISCKGLPGRAGTRKVVQLNFRPLLPLVRGKKALSTLQCPRVCGHGLQRVLCPPATVERLGPESLSRLPHCLADSGVCSNFPAMEIQKIFFFFLPACFLNIILKLPDLFYVPLKEKAASGLDHTYQGTSLCRLLLCLCSICGTPEEKLQSRAKQPELGSCC